MLTQMQSVTERESPPHLIMKITVVLTVNYLSTDTFGCDNLAIEGYVRLKDSA